MKSTLVRWGGTALMIAALAGCGGGGGGTAATTTTGTGTTTTPPASTTPTVAVPTGTAPITLTASTPPATFAALTPTVTVGGVTINSPPTVTFSVTDSKGNAIIGLGATSQKATATVPSYSNIKFALAKLVPGTGSAPSRWVSYIVMTVPTKDATTGAITASVPTRPSTDSSGTLVDHGDGTYTYTFFTDVKTVAAQVAAATLTAPNVAADLDDLTYDPTLVHRLTIEISGSAPGTGTNTSDGSTSSVAAVPMTHPIDAVYDFIPATGQAVTASGRDIVATAKCNACHNVLGGIPGDTTTDDSASFHGGTRNDTKYCVVCHTEQRKYGRTEATTTATGYSGSTYEVNGFAVGKLPTHIHKIHMGTALTKTGYNYGGVLYNDIKYPQDVQNCTTCHDGTAGAANATAQGDNWKNVPSREACGACHDGINFATGGGYTLADFYAGTQDSSVGHIGGAKADDSQCALCHDATTIPVYHTSVTPGVSIRGLTGTYSVASQANLPAGAAKFTYKISSVTVDATTGNPTVVFQILNNGTPVSFNAKGSTEMLTGFGITGPTIEIAFAVPQDNITAPADFNASGSAAVANLWDGTKGTLSGPDASGNYTAVLTGVKIPLTAPTKAVMVTALLGYGAFVQDKGYNGLSTKLYPSGLVLPAQAVQMVATGYTARRQIVSTDKCNACHQQLGLFTDDNFHAGYYNDAQGCPICHTANLASHSETGWTASLPYWVHSIHAAGKRTVPFTETASATDGFYSIKYPGMLKNCENCHLAGTYDFSAPASAAALPNRLYNTAVAGTIVAGTANLSPYVTPGAYDAVFAFNAATDVTTPAGDNTLVISPIATACVACHDTTLAIQHMQVSGNASFYLDRKTALTKQELCMTCHDSTSVYGLGIAAVHSK